MNQQEDFQEGLQYSDEVINAIRYGYQYRKKIEDKEGDNALHYYLPINSQVVLWLGKLILDGLVWDAIKTLAKYLYNKLLMSDTPLDNLSKALLTEEAELERFYTYLKEYQEHSMSITKQQFEYIREEICADYFAKESLKIFENEQRFPTHQEILDLHIRATKFADDILGRKE
jgi:hypothetical protein